MSRDDYYRYAFPDELWLSPADGSITGGFDADWYCPLCGAGNTGSVCWNCGYALGSEVTGIWDEPEIWDEDYGSGWGAWGDDWGYTGWDSWDDWDYFGY